MTCTQYHNRQSVNQILLQSKIEPLALSPSPYKSQKSVVKSGTTEASSINTTSLSSISHSHKIASLKYQICTLEQAQQTMQKKFESCIDSLLKQIQQKEQHNQKLLHEVTALKGDIQESKKDIQVIVGYVRKNSLTKKSHKQKANANLLVSTQIRPIINGPNGSERKTLESVHSMKKLLRSSEKSDPVLGASSKILRAGRFK